MNLSQVYSLILSTNDEAKDLLKKLSQKPPPTDHKHYYMRSFYKSLSESKKYYPEYEELILQLFDENTEYSPEFVNYLNQFLKSLCFLGFYEEYYKILGLVRESNIPHDIKSVGPLFGAGIKNNLYIGMMKNQELAKENQKIIMNFTKMCLKKTKSFEIISTETLKSKNFLYMLKTFKTAKDFFDSIDFEIVQLPEDINSFTKDLSQMIIMLLQNMDVEAAKQFTDLLFANEALRKQYELVLYRKTLHSNDELIGDCMKITSKLIAAKKSVISTEMMIMDTIIGQSLIQFSKESCEKIVNMFMGVLHNLKSLSNESNYFTCCTSLRQHICITILVNTLKLLLAYLKDDTVQEPNEDFQESVEQISQYFLQVIKKFQCSSFKHDLRHIYLTFFEISKVVTTDSWAQFVIELFQDIFNEPACQSNMYAAEEVRSFIILYSKVTSDIDLAPLEELNALYVGHLLKGNNSKLKIQEKIVKYYKDTKPASTIVEAIENNTSHRKPTDFDVATLRREERGICTKWYKYMIPKLAVTAISDMDYILVAMQDEDTVDHERLSSIYNRTMKELTAKGLDDESRAEKYLTLAYITKIEVLRQSHLLKDNVKVKANLQEDEFIEEMDTLSSQLSLISLSKESDLIEKARESIEYFTRFLSTKSKSMEADWDQITSYVSHLARIFYIRGYISDKTVTMRLLFKIAELSNNEITLIQALSFFLETSNLRSTEFDKIIEEKLPLLEDLLLEKYTILASLKSPRTENTVLFCFINLAYYYYLRNDKEMCALLLKMVKDAIDLKLSNQIGRDSVIRTYLHLTRYRILTKEKDYTLEGAVALSKEVERIWNVFKHQVFISSEDAVVFPALLFDVINELFVYHSLRWTTQKMVPYVRLMFTLGLANGCSLRAIQTTSIYLYNQYQSESMTKFLAIVRIIKNLIGKDFLPKDDSAIENVKESAEPNVNKKKVEVIDLTNDEVSITVRREGFHSKRNNNIVKKIFTPDNTSFSIEAFIEEASRYGPEIQESLFIVITSYTKLLSENSSVSVDTYFKKLYEYRKTMNPDLNPTLHMMFFISYLNLIRHKCYKPSSIKQMTDRAMRHFKDYSQRLDHGLKLNIVSQFSSSQ